MTTKLKVYHGRKGEPNEYIEIKMIDENINLVAQKLQPARSNTLWLTFIVGRGSNCPVRAVEVFKEDEFELAKRSLETMYYTLRKERIK